MEVIKKRWLDLIKQKPLAFGLETGYTDLTDIHNEWIKSFLFAKEDKTLQAHRRILQDNVPGHRNGTNDCYLSYEKYHLLT